MKKVKTQVKKKNIKKKNKHKNNRFIIIVFTVLGIILFSLMVFKIAKNNAFFRVVDRTGDIKDYKKENDYTIVGWIRIQGTNIDYPVLFYDDAPISDVTQDIAWTYRKVKKLDDRTVIEGHNILNLSSNPLIADSSSKRFEQLLSFYDYNFSSNNKYIEYSLGNDNYVFKIYAVGFVEPETYYTKHKYTKEEKKDYIDRSLNSSLYEFDVDIDENDKLISLYTCTRFYGYSDSVVFKVDGRLLRKDESTNNYKIKKTKKYDEVEKYVEEVRKSQEVSS